MENMKNAKSGPETVGRSAEDWVQVAKQFGEKCVVIQKDAKISHEEKLKRQDVLAKEMEKEIHGDTHLKEVDKKQMLQSIHSYMDEWKTIHHALEKHHM